MVLKSEGMINSTSSAGAGNGLPRFILGATVKAGIRVY